MAGAAYDVACGPAVTPGTGNSITDIAGLRVGHAQDPVLKSGVTVLTADAPFTAACHVMGGAPGTRETDLLDPSALVDQVDALVLAGGSAFGLDAAAGVVAGLRAAGRGFVAAGHPVPIVPAAILFDLAGGGRHDWEVSPYPALGRAAFDAAGRRVAIGSVGAGTGAMTARLKGGIGTASCVTPGGALVGALVAANPVGCTCEPETGRFWAALAEQGAEFGGRGVPDRAAPCLPATKLTAGAHTTIAIVATDATLDKAQARRMAVAAHDGMARAILPSHTPFDGDLVFAASTGRGPVPDPAEALWLGHAAATALARAVARAIHAARPAPGDARPCWAELYG